LTDIGNNIYFIITVYIPQLFSKKSIAMIFLKDLIKKGSIILYNQKPANEYLQAFDLMMKADYILALY